jgi:uncharacterized protein
MHDDQMALVTMTTRSSCRSLEIIRSVRGIATSEWDSVVAGNVTGRHGWLLAVEEAGLEGIEPHYVLHREGRQLVGVAICYLNRGGQPGLSPDDVLLGRLRPVARRLGVSFSPALMCAPYRGYGVQLFGVTREALLDGMEALARAEALPVYLPRVPEEETDLHHSLAERGYHRTVDHPIARLDIAWNSFEGYLDALGHKGRAMVRHEMKRNQRAGVVIREIDEPWAVAPRLHELVQAHHLRRNGTCLPFPPSLLPRLKELLGRSCIIYGAFKGGELVGFTVLLRDGHTGFLPFVGIDGAGKGDFIYFNLCYYRPIADAIMGGLRRLFFGILLYDLKARRGCRIVRTSLFYKGAAPAWHLAVGPWFWAHGWWAARYKFASALALATKDQRDA